MWNSKSRSLRFMCTVTSKLSFSWKGSVRATDAERSNFKKIDFFVDCKYTSHDRCKKKVVTECQQRSSSPGNHVKNGHKVTSSTYTATTAAADEETSPSISSDLRSETTGHYFKRKTFHKPTYCNYCSDLLWGLTNQGMQCNGIYLIIFSKFSNFFIFPKF